MCVEDYDILSILGNNISSTTYKVKHKKTGKIFVWQTYENKNDGDKECILEKIKAQSDICHPNILKFYDCINQKENNNLYLVTEYCEHGSLKNLVESCVKSSTFISEELVCRVLYQISFAVKTVNYTGKLSTKEIFIDEEFNAKLFNFEINDKNKTLKEIKMSQLGLILYEMCTLTKYNGKKYEAELKQIGNIFSHSLLSLITCLIKDKSELKKHINKILCHPTVLLKSAQWHKEKSFINIETIVEPIPVPKDVTDQEEVILYTTKIEKLKIREDSLRVREQQLNEREYKLIMKERKVSLMERSIREKLQKAELYLKRCKECKSVSSEGSKYTINSQKKTTSYENLDLDSTYVSCGDSILLPTSSKLNVNKIIKPAPFTRTLSERRIRFKGHSPLKDIDYNKRKSVRQSKSQKGMLVKKSSEWLTCSEDTDKSSIDGGSRRTHDKSKQLFSTKGIYENANLASVDMQCKPIVWTENSKKYAFELLKAMNVDKENQYPEVKHTYL